MRAMIGQSAFAGFCGRVKEPGVPKNVMKPDAMPLEKQERQGSAMSRYFLWYGRTRLGVLTEYEKDWPWTSCHFVADPPFAEFQPLFEESDRLLERWQQGGDREAWWTVSEKIIALDLFLKDEGGRKGKPWRLHISDRVARFRLEVPYWQKEA